MVQPCTKPYWSTCGTARLWCPNNFWFFGTKAVKDRQSVSLVPGHCNVLGPCKGMQPSSQILKVCVTSVLPGAAMPQTTAENMCLMSQRNFLAQKELESSSFVSQGGALTTAAYFPFLFLLNRFQHASSCPKSQLHLCLCSPFSPLHLDLPLLCLVTSPASADNLRIRYDIQIPLLEGRKMWRGKKIKRQKKRKLWLSKCLILDLIW